jgi:lipid II:glycine glycyltransferase (peptidoglycan interpeptide bridge formation enzyme)
MQIIEIDDAREWDSKLLFLPNPQVLQSWAWGEFKSRHGWSATRLLWQKDGKAVAAASLLARKAPRMPFPLLYAPKGPLLDWADAGLVERVLADLEDLARERRALCLKIDPDLYYLDHSPAFSPRPACAQDTSQLLTQRGWRYSDEQIQYCNTVLLDLDRPEGGLLGAMKQKTRYNVRLAARRGVVVHEGTTADLATFFELYAETSRRDGFLIRPRDYYQDVWGSFLEAGLAHLLLAEVEGEGEAVAGLILFTFGPTAWYMYGASSVRHRRAMPNNLLQWEAIRLARAAGCTLYDLWGAPDRLDESDPMWGVVRFKLGLGGQLAQGIGAWDYPGSRVAYWLYSSILPRYVGWLQKRHQSQEAASDGMAG